MSKRLVAALSIAGMALATLHPALQPGLEAGVWDNVKNFFVRPMPATPPTISVLVAHDLVGVVVEVKGKYKIFDPRTNDHISTRFLGKRKFMQAVSGGLKWGEEFPGVFQLKITPDDASTTTLVNGVEYKGSLYIYDIGGTVSVVNEVAVEDYLSSILSPLFPDPMPEEALAAVAITARTSAYYFKNNPRSQYFAVDGSTVDYTGAALTTSATPIDRAINATRYMYMVKEEDGVSNAFLAQWGSPTGGKSDREKAVFSRISLFDAENFASQGEHAAQILEKAFPGTKIELGYNP